MSASNFSRQNLLLRSLAPSPCCELERHFERVHLTPGTLLIKPLNAIEFVYFPHSGVVTLLASTAKGAAVETGMIGREGVVGASASFGTRPASVKAIVHIAGAADRIPYPVFQEIFGANDGIRHLVSEYTERLLATAQQAAACNALHEVVERLARVLLQTVDRIEGELIPLTQQSLSEIVGVRRTTINAAARGLQASGAIRYSRGRILLVDRAVLEAAACECYGIVRPQALEPTAVSSPSIQTSAASPPAA